MFDVAQGAREYSYHSYLSIHALLLSGSPRMLLPAYNNAPPKRVRNRA